MLIASRYAPRARRDDGVRRIASIVNQSTTINAHHSHSSKNAHQDQRMSPPTRAHQESTHHSPITTGLDGLTVTCYALQQLSREYTRE